MKRFSLFSIFIVLILCVSPLHATINLTFDGKASGISFAQGDPDSWIISGIPNGATVTNQIWIDFDSNGVVSSNDIMIYTFLQTDGALTGDMRDKDSTVNGIIYSESDQNGLMPAHYIFKSIYATDTASVTFTVIKMSSPTYTVSGTIKKSAAAVANIAIVSSGNISGEWLALTDSNGKYTMDTKAVTGETKSISLLTSTIPNGYYAFPTKYDVTFNANIIGIDFALEKSTGVAQTTSALPKVYSLSQNYPNPFNPATNIRYSVPTSSKVKLTIYNMLGQTVDELINEEQTAGWKEVHWNANVASGMYFYRLESVSVTDPNNRFVEVKKMLFLK